MPPRQPTYAESPDRILKRLDYLDLHGELKDVFEIKLMVAFKFIKKQGQFCRSPSMATTIHSSRPFETEAEVITATIIHDIFLGQLCPLVRQRWFGWDTVELPKKMLTAPIAPSEHDLLDAFLFPSPSDSRYLSRHPQSTPDDSLMSFTSSLLTNSFDTATFNATTVRSVNSDSFSSFGSPKFTSTPFPHSSALPACVDHNLTANELLASGITGQRATPRHVEQPDLQSPVHAVSPTRRIKQHNDSDPTPKSWNDPHTPAHQPRTAGQPNSPKLLQD
ncbi:hypothetical protein AZE42_13299 [Rhizopogon vesiculosus]|uniref:Uncharacterized protein n=1 Tax=Rhizopogon vesiculosus TaxID=180088 RepID=A0A1J8QTA5_9AGAM|nr:hypothetical protein AZE42_13299 [Rhizopogon vesiculosus]